uniref:Small ribosomal subunit protein uS3c n=1 Tax=Rhipsalis teres TaxID=169218 RepID=A0A894JGT9_9CARY|nr:ribosomal protein S3 [Rhipsalis teres]QRV60126.1 ribosomal protein S3 [Rhipsalis teres]
MARKINPLGFRLGTTQDHYSFWFAQSKNYSEGLQEDLKIRNFILKYVQEKYVQKKKRTSSDVEGIARIEIEKRIDLIQIIIHMVFPKLLIEKRSQGIKDLKINIQKELNCVNRKLNIGITRIAKPYRHPNLLAEFITLQLRNRVHFRKAMKKAMELAKQAEIKGIKIQIAGRLGGKDIARVAWIREGRVPLQTIRAKIDYCAYPIRTIYGILCIKIWIFIDDK